MKQIRNISIFFLLAGCMNVPSQTVEEPADPVDWVNPLMGTHIQGL